MSKLQCLELEMRSDPCELGPVRQQIRSWAIERAWSEQQAEEIVLALDEALTNVIRHGYEGNPTKKICVCASEVEDSAEGQGLEIRVRDFGKQVDPAEICGRDLENIRPGGLGVHIIRSMNSTVEYQRADDGGMLLIMRKYRTHHASGGDAGVRHV